MSARWKGRIGFAALVLLALASAAAPLLSRIDSLPACPLPTDPRLGVSSCARIGEGLWRSLGVGIFSGGLSCAIALALALLARRLGNVADTLITRGADLFFAVPDVLVLIGMRLAALQLERVSGAQVWPFAAMIASLTAVGWAAPTRMVRNRLRTLESQEFVFAAEAIGATRWRILTGELLPFAREYLLAIFLLRVPATILAESTVSFLGLGLPPDAPSLGSFLGSNYQLILNEPSLVAPAWILLVLIVVAFQWTGQALVANAESER
jgi:ABC-type dipeptide/oligopeptide/nickel transport system permease subunit